VTRKHHLLDEDDVRVRPGRGKSRPRSKDRPEHAEALSGTVMTVDRGRFTVELDDGTELYAIKARELGRKGIVVGDHVDIVGDVSGDTDTQGRIVRRDERSSTLRRTADDDDPVERVVVANANQLAVVTATIDPAPRTGLIDRAIVAALDAGIEPMLVVTKTDLKPPDELLALYGPLDLPLFTITGKQVPDELRRVLDGQATVLVGHSGVGKSTLVNTLIHVGRIINAFPDLAALTEGCPRACSHDEPDCALNDVSGASADQATLAARIDSLRRLIRSRTSAIEDDPTT
jgi:ribosome biogenesis GTPase